MKNLKKIKGDASFREFYRKKGKNTNSIIVLAKKEKFKENYKKNYIDIQDFGDQTIFKILRKKKINKLFYFKKIINLMCKIQLIKSRNIINFRNKIYYIPKYNRKILINEANLFSKWYAAQNLKSSKKKNFSKRI